MVFEKKDSLRARRSDEVALLSKQERVDRKDFFRGDEVEIFIFKSGHFGNETGLDALF